jgi:hypothetical protein
MCQCVGVHVCVSVWGGGVLVILVLVPGTDCRPVLHGVQAFCAGWRLARGLSSDNNSNMHPNLYPCDPNLDESDCSSQAAQVPMPSSEPVLSSSPSTSKGNTKANSHSYTRSSDHDHDHRRSLQDRLGIASVELDTSHLKHDVDLEDDDYNHTTCAICDQVKPETPALAQLP